MGELFTEDFIRNLPEWDKRARNPHVVALCKRGEPDLDAHRTEVEAWYSHLPDDVKPDFFKRLRSKVTHTHLGAMYELFFHEYFLQKGWEVQYEPPLGNLTPDFLVCSSDGDILFYCEVRNIFSSKDTQEWERRIDDFQTAVMKASVRPGFGLLFNYKQIPMADFDHRAVISQIQQWLQRLPCEEDGPWHLPIKEGALVGNVQALRSEADPPLPDGFLAWTGPVVRGMEAAERLQEIVFENSNKYKAAASTPIIIAACDETSMRGVDRDAAIDKLYGEEKIVVPIGPEGPLGEATTYREHDGAYTRQNRNDGRLKRWYLSGVFVCVRKWGAQGIEFQLDLYHNLYADAPLQEDLFRDIPQFSEMSRDDTNITMGWIGEDLGPIQLGAGQADD